MVKRVIKKNGKKQKFSSKKIKKSIIKAASGAKRNKKLRERIANTITEHILYELEDFDELTTARIRDMVLKELDSMDRATFKAWIAYELKKMREKD